MSVNPIEAVAARIQRVDPRVRWIHSQQNIILAEAFRSRPEIGLWGARAGRIVAVADKLGLGNAVAALINLILLMRIFFLQRRVALQDLKPLLFVGMGAIRESHLVEHFAKRFGQPISLADETDLASFSAYRRLGLIACVQEWWRVWSEIRTCLPDTYSQGLSRAYCLSYLLMVGHKVIYLRAWFRRHLELGCRLPVGFSAASWSASAAVSAGVEAVYLQHGFQAHSIVYPEFKECDCFNRFEANHIQGRLPHAFVKVVFPPVEKLETERLAAIAADYGQPSDKDLIKSFLDWAKHANLRVVIRPHPRQPSQYWEQWRRKDNIHVSDDDCDFSTFLRLYRPRILVTWYSTTLFDALLHGVVPVTVAQDDLLAARTVFPFRRIALNWPDQKAIVQSIVNDADASAALVNKKYLEMVGAAFDLEEESEGRR